MHQSTRANTVAKLSLHGSFNSFPESLRKQHDVGIITDPPSLGGLRREWERAHRAYSGLGPDDRTYTTLDDTVPIEGIAAEAIERVQSEVRRHAPFNSASFELRLVRLAAVVTPQAIINQDRASGLVPNLSLGAQELFDISFPQTRSPVEIRHRTRKVGPWEGFDYFAVDDEDFRVQIPADEFDIPEVPTSTHPGVKQILGFALTSGQPFVSIWRIPTGNGGRLIITNGIHRAYRLLTSGIEWIPAVFLSTARIGAKDVIADFSWGELMNPMARPPMLIDFLSPDLNIRLKCRRSVAAATLHWKYEMHYEPYDEQNPFRWAV